jgi:hypothetical protein
MKTIPAHEINRRGIGAIDEALKDGPVYVVEDNVPRYVVLDAARYRGLARARDLLDSLGLDTGLEEAKPTPSDRDTIGLPADLSKAELLDEGELSAEDRLCLAEADADLEAMTRRLTAELRQRHPEVFDRRGRLRRRALSQLLIDNRGHLRSLTRSRSTRPTHPHGR